MHGLFLLLKRYWQVYRAARAEEKNWQQHAYSPEEAEFLPAALALQKSPMSPLPRRIMWAIVFFAVIVVVWACFGKIEQVSIASGKIIPNDKIKVIQPFENGTVKAIYVRDGQQVKANQLLIEFDAQATTADVMKYTEDLHQAELDVARAEAMLAALQYKRLPRIIIEHLPASLIKDNQAQVVAQYQELQTKLNNLEIEILGKQAEAEGVLAQIEKLEKTTKITGQLARDYKDMVDQSLVPKHQQLEKEQAALENIANLKMQRSRLKEIQVAKRGQENAKANLLAESKRINLELLTNSKQKVASLTQELNKASYRATQTQLKSPVEGEVQQLATHTIGGVVTVAQPLMVIVPRDHPLEIEAVIENKDIGFVKVGQEAEIKLETFPYTKYGTISGKISHISNDAIQDEKRGLIYVVRVTLNQSSLLVDGKLVNLSPGMAASVEIKTGERRVIEYFLSPLIQYTKESLRER